MVLGKLFRLYHKTDSKNIYSVLLMNKNDRDQTLIFESGAIGVLSSHEAESVKPSYRLLIDVYGCLGVLDLTVADGQPCRYLVCVAGCTSIGKLHQTSEIFAVTETLFVPLHGHQADLDRVQDVRKILDSRTFYFSWSGTLSQTCFDLTLCCQKAEHTDVTDNRFFWNRMLFLPFKSFDIDTDRWLLKIMCGSVTINTVFVGHRQAKAVLISRLSNERAGTRFNVRGVNDYGYVANFVETEQVIFSDENVASYVMIRGSIPLFWEQSGVQVGGHRVKLSRGNRLCHPAFERHLATVQYLYGRTVILNLVGMKEGEQLVGSMFRAHHHSSRFKDDIPYVTFDYHYHCARGREDSLHSILREQIAPYIEQYGFYLRLADGQKRYQTGTFRVNCIDCLDRTNRVQTFLGLDMLERQLHALGLDEKSTIKTRFFEVYKNMWQVNGDQISRIYAGTGALEGKSMLRDGTLSVARTIQNNLLDSSKQEAIDMLLTGKPSTIDHNDRIRSLLPGKYLHMPNKLLRAVVERQFEFTEPMQIRVAVGTWNVNGGKHMMFGGNNGRNLSLAEWLLDANRPGAAAGQVVNILDMSLEESLTPSPDGRPDTPDIYAIGFEEIVDLSAQNIVNTSSTNKNEWLAELERTLCRDEQYVEVATVQLVGVCLFVFVKPKHARFIRDVATDQVKTGLGGAAGNKGGVAVRFRFYNSALCFVCSHFAAGQQHVNERNSDFIEISRRMFNSIGRSLASHDYVFWCGDFNYRIDMASDEVKRLIQERDWSQLLERDQLQCQQKAGKVFRKYYEAEIDFAPTYKYDINSDEYDTSEKARIPAWTDRILYRKMHATHREEKLTDQLEYGQVLFYGRAELKTSDHRPVFAEFLVEILRVDDERLESVFRDVVHKIGPPDATVLVRPADDGNGIEPNHIEAIIERFGGDQLVLARLKADQIQLTFKDSTVALQLVQTHSGGIDIAGKRFELSLKTPDWLKLIEQQIEFGVSNTLPMTEQCTRCDIDQLDYYILPTIQRSWEDEHTIAAVTEDPIIDAAVLIPVRPPPPSQNRTTASMDDNGWQKSTGNNIIPHRSAPPPPSQPKNNVVNGSIAPPPVRPPPAVVRPVTAVTTKNPEDDEDEEGGEEEEEDEEEDDDEEEEDVHDQWSRPPSMAAPIMAPTVPPPVLPPPPSIPSRGPPPSIPPRTRAPPPPPPPPSYR